MDGGRYNRLHLQSIPSFDQRLQGPGDDHDTPWHRRGRRFNVQPFIDIVHATNQISRQSPVSVEHRGCRKAALAKESESA